MFKMSTFSLVFIKSDHDVLSICLSLVTLSFGLHRSHVSSIIIASQELLGRVDLQSTGTELPQLAMRICLYLSQLVLQFDHTVDLTQKRSKNKRYKTTPFLE